MPVTYTRKIRVKFKAGGTEPDRLVMTALVRGGGTSSLIDTLSTKSTVTQDLSLANNVTGVRIQITTDSTNIRADQNKWTFGVANSGVNPF